MTVNLPLPIASGGDPEFRIKVEECGLEPPLTQMNGDLGRYFVVATAVADEDSTADWAGIRSSHGYVVLNVAAF
jgi:hypothetical protein